MKPRSAPRKAPPPHADAPLELHERVKRVQQRLHSEVLLTLNELPPTARTPAAITRHLKLKGPICFRLLQALRNDHAPADFFAAIPGPEGLTRVAVAARRAGVGETRINGLRAAISDFESLLQHVGGSQRRLVTQLQGGADSLPAPPVEGTMADHGAAPDPARPVSVLDDRRAIFQSMSRVLKCRSRGVLGIRICSPADNGSLDFPVVGVSGRIGFERRSVSLPYVVQHGTAQSPGPAATAAQDLIIPQFSSSPPPPTVVDVRGEATICIIDQDNTHAGPVDVVVGPIAASYKMWRNRSERGLNTGMSIAIPSEWLVTDTYVPRRFAHNAQASMGSYLIGAMGYVVSDPREAWFARMPGSSAVTPLGVGLANADCDQYPRQTELTATLFDAAKLDPADYVGFRIAIEYPIVNTYYLLSLRKDL